MISAGFKAVSLVYRALRMVPCARRLEGVVLDTLLGPVEDFDCEPLTTRSPQ